MVVRQGIKALQLIVLNNRPIAFFTKSAMDLPIMTRISTYFLPILFFTPVTILSIARIFFLPGGLLRYIPCLGNPGLSIGPVT